MYRVFRPLLFCLPPELAHSLSLRCLKITYHLGLNRLFARKNSDPIEIFGLHFKNRIGIAAGLDKNGDYIDCLASLGVGFIEVGGITPKPQKGNPKPRVFRFPKQRAMINWLGLNNKGIGHLVRQLKRSKRNCIIGVNLAKNHTTTNANAADDYCQSLESVYPYADYVCINISCPNSSNIEALQEYTQLKQLLTAIQDACEKCQTRFCKPMPVLVKISPDIDETTLKQIVALCLELNIAGIVATNTSTEHQALSTPIGNKGGLSGAPLAEKSENVLRHIKAQAPDLPVISVGGIMTADDIQKRLSLGASLVQVYSGLIYEGPTLLKQ